MGCTRRTIEILKNRISDLEREVVEVAAISYSKGVEAERERHMRFLSGMMKEPRIAAPQEFL